MKVFLNPGHAPNGNPDPGAVNYAMNLRESDIAESIAVKVQDFLIAAGVDVVGCLQSDSLEEICDTANHSGADIFVSIHCNAFNACARGTEVEVYPSSTEGRKLAECVQNQIVTSLGTVDRGAKDRPNLYVLKHTDMPAILVETAFIDNGEDAELLRDRSTDFAAAIARGITDYENDLNG